MGEPLPNSLPDETLFTKTVNTLISFPETVAGFFSQYGWFIVIAVVALGVLWSKLEPWYQRQKKKKEEDEYSAAIHKDPDLFRSRQEGMAAARQRMQQKLDAEAVKFKEQEAEKEEAKRRAKLEEWEKYKQGKSYRTKVRSQEEEQSVVSKPSKKPKPRLREEYNPLMGGGGSSFRAARRCGTGGG